MECGLHLGMLQGQTVANSSQQQRSLTSIWSITSKAPSSWAISITAIIPCGAWKYAAFTYRPIELLHRSRRAAGSQSQAHGRRRHEGHSGLISNEEQQRGQRKADKADPLGPAPTAHRHLRVHAGGAGQGPEESTVQLSFITPHYDATRLHTTPHRPPPPIPWGFTECSLSEASFCLS